MRISFNYQKDIFNIPRVEILTTKTKYWLQFLATHTKKNSHCNSCLKIYIYIYVFCFFFGSICVIMKFTGYNDCVHLFRLFFLSFQLFSLNILFWVVSFFLIKQLLLIWCFNVYNLWMFIPEREEKNIKRNEIEISLKQTLNI